LASASLEARSSGVCFLVLFRFIVVLLEQVENPIDATSNIEQHIHDKRRVVRLEFVEHRLIVDVARPARKASFRAVS
jgi:hypothetical protein